MTFFIQVKKDGRADASIIRVRASHAIHVARKLADDGWSVSITCPDGERYAVNRFDVLLWKDTERPDIPCASVWIFKSADV